MVINNLYNCYNVNNHQACIFCLKHFINGNFIVSLYLEILKQIWYCQLYTVIVVLFPLRL